MEVEMTRYSDDDMTRMCQVFLGVKCVCLCSNLG